LNQTSLSSRTVIGRLTRRIRSAVRELAGLKNPRRFPHFRILQGRSPRSTVRKPCLGERNQWPRKERNTGQTGQTANLINSLGLRREERPSGKLGQPWPGSQGGICDSDKHTLYSPSGMRLCRRRIPRRSQSRASMRVRTMASFTPVPHRSVGAGSDRRRWSCGAEVRTPLSVNPKYGTRRDEDEAICWS